MNCSVHFSCLNDTSIFIFFLVCVTVCLCVRARTHVYVTTAGTVQSHFAHDEDDAARSGGGMG